MGAPQLRHLPRSHNHVSSGIFRYHGIEYLQCGQCDGGETMLCPSGNRWIQTLRKLPILQPKTKNTMDQKWNGRRDQTRASKVFPKISANSRWSTVISVCVIRL